MSGAPSGGVGGVGGLIGKTTGVGAARNMSRTLGRTLVNRFNKNRLGGVSKNFNILIFTKYLNPAFSSISSISFI